MRKIICEQCGSNDFVDKNGLKTCRYCGSNYTSIKQKAAAHSSSITLNDDIKMLLQKCENDPANASRYASLVLDIDPGNLDAMRYL